MRKSFRVSGELSAIAADCYSPDRDPGETKKPRREAGLPDQASVTWRPGLLGYDVGRAETFRALLDVVGDGLPFGQRLAAATLDGAEMDEDVLGSVGRCDEAETLVVAEPLDCACSHYGYLW